MAPRIKITKQEIIEQTYELIRTQGVKLFTARSIAKALNISTQPIFSSFESLIDLKKEIKNKALNLYHTYIEEGLKMDKPFKGTGIKYIEFAKKEPNLFYLLFMDDNQDKVDNIKIESIEHQEAQRKLIEKTLKCSTEQSKLIQLESWIFVHGIASLIVTKTVQFDDELISNLLTDFFKNYLNKENE